MKRLRHFTVKGLGEVGVRVISSLTIFALAHVLGATRFGEYSTAFSFVTLFAVAADLGCGPIVMREIARSVEERHRILASGNLVKIIATLVVLAAVHTASHWSTFARQHLLLVDTLAVVSISYVWVDYLGVLLAGKEEFGWEAVLKVFCRLLISGAGIVVLFRTQSLLWVTSTMAIAAVFSLSQGALIIRRRFGAFPVFWDGPMTAKILRSSLPVLGFVVFWTFYDNQDVLILNHLQVPARDIGLFWSATKVLDVLKVAPIILSTIFLPDLARFARARESFIQTARHLLAGALLLDIALAGAAWLAAPWIERLLYGKQFVEAAPLLRLLMPAFALSFFNHCFIQMLIAQDHEKRILPGAMIACLSNLAFSLWWIPTYGTTGACFALIGSELLFFLFQAQLIFESVPGLLNPFRKTFG